MNQPFSLAASLLRSLFLSAAAVAVCWPLTILPGLIAAGVAAALGSVAGDRLGRSRLQWLAQFVLAGVVGGLGMGLGRFLVDTPYLAEASSPRQAFQASEAIFWFFAALPVTLIVRSAAVRAPSMAILEVILGAIALTSSVAAHRDGMIHRPLMLSDWAWSRNIDPVIVLLLLGGAGSLLLASLLLREERKRRIPLHFLMLGLIALILLFVIRFGGVPGARSASDLGLTGEPKEGQGKQGQGRGGGGGQGDSKGKPPQDNDLQFRDNYSPQGLQAPLAIVILHGDYSPPTGMYYFRQSAFSQYNGQRLVQTTRDDVDQDIIRAFPSQRTEIPGAPEPSEQRMELQTTVGLLADHPKPFALDSPKEIWPIPNPDPMRFRRAYRAACVVLTLPYEQMFGHKSGSPDWTEQQWRHYTEAPKDPRYRELALSIVKDLRPEYREDPLAQSVMLLQWMGKNCIYSRKSRHASAEDPTADFLFGDRTGYCVHMAHAMVFLLRSLGLPARVAAGYAIDESDRAGGSSVLIRAGNGHAWPELYIESLGWVVVDVSPERSLDPPDPGVDQGLQRMLGQMIRKPPKDPRKKESDSWQLPSLAQVTRASLYGLAAIVLLGYAVKLYRAALPRWSSSRGLYRVAYRAGMDRLAEIGLRRRRAESREDFARRALPRAPAFGGLTFEHLSLAFGVRRPADEARLRSWADQIGEQARAAAPWWRWLLGVLHPFSWWFVR